MSLLLDTNICSAYLKRPGRLAHRFIQHGGGLYLRTIALGELYVWAELRVAAVDTFSLIEDDLLKVVQLLDFDDHCAREYGRLRTDSLRRGTNLSPPDLMIAATA